MQRIQNAHVIIGLYWNDRSKKWDGVVNAGSLTVPINFSAESQVEIDRVNARLLAAGVQREIESWLI